jgi:hypothetical protein
MINWKPEAANWERAKSDPHHMEFCMMNEYFGVRQMEAMIWSAGDVAERDDVRPDIWGDVLAAIKSEYEQFHAPTDTAWKPSKTVVSLYSKDATVDNNFRRRAERHIRGMVKFLLQTEEVEAYLAKKAQA